ncbi:MAG: alpha/beta hydrolase family protein [Lachnospiraceae bacterium]|nr:alpha/beta hydrolase family protein [Lachnospiraceae bacterium]
MYYEEIEAFCERYDRTEKTYAFRADTPEQREIWREKAAGRLKEISGLNMCRTTEGNYRCLDSRRMESYTKEYWIMDTEPGITMPFYLLRPNQPNGAAILSLHGHGGGKETVVRDWSNPAVFTRPEKYKDASLAEIMAEKGFFVLCPDERGSGERRESFQQGDSAEAWRSCSHREIQQIALGFGQSMLGLAIWDLMRLVDFAETIPEIRKGALGCAGMSGGGLQTLWLAALDQRICAAVTSGYFYGMRDSLIRMANNCSCNYVPFMWQTMDMGDLAAMIAPRPLFIESGEKDPLSGHRGLENVYEQLDITMKAYALYHAEDKLIHSVHPGGHVWNGTGVCEFFMENLCFIGQNSVSLKEQ